MNRGRKRENRPQRRQPRKATPDYLRNSALHYLERYATSSAHLRRLLLVKVARSAAAHDTDAEAGAAAVETLIGRLIAQGLLDDAAYARTKALSLHRRGGSARAIRGRLARMGLGPDLIDAAFVALAEDVGDAEFAAALSYARRRRLGPFRADPAAREDRRDRDLAALGRRGFSYELARRILDAESPEALEDSDN